MEEDWSVHYRFLPWYKSFHSDLSELRSGGFAGAMNATLSSFGLELLPRAIVGSAKGRWVLDIHHYDYLFPGFLSILDFKLRCVNGIQASLNDWLESGRRTLLYSIWKSCVRQGWEVSPEEPEEPEEPSIVVVSAVVLLSLVYQYLTGNVDRGGSKAYSRRSLDFRDIYVATVLFLGAYVWIKFREAALRGAHRRIVWSEQGITRKVYEARLTPPMWNGKKVRKLDLGRFATPQEAHNKFLIAAFYYDRASGFLDGWFRVPPMSEEERRLTGLKLREWVLGQAKKVYEDFKQETALWRGLLEASEDEVPPQQDEVDVDPCGTSLLNSAEHQQPALASQAENSVMLDNHVSECASHSLDGMHAGPALPNGHSLGFGEGSALPGSQLPPNTECLNGSDRLDLLQFQSRVITSQPQQISLQQNQISDPQQQVSLQQQLSEQQQQISLLQQQVRELRAHVLPLQHPQDTQQQQLPESRIQNPLWPCQFCFQQQQLQDVNPGVSVFEMEMEQSVHQQNYPGLMTPPPDGGEAQEAVGVRYTYVHVA